MSKLDAFTITTKITYYQVSQSVRLYFAAPKAALIVFLFFKIEPFEITDENVDHTSYSPLEVSSLTITTDESEKERLFSFGIGQHLSRQLDAQKCKMNSLWFYNHLKDEAFGNCNSDNEFQIIAYLTFTRRTETLKEDFISSNIWNYCDDNHGGTYLVQEVEYGAEFVFRMRKSVDPLKETKQSVKQTMELTLDNYLENFFNDTSSPPIFNRLFETMSCSFQSSIGNGFMYSGTFDQCLQKIQEMTNMEKNDRQNTWRPVAMQLRRIPTRSEIRVAMDYFKDTAFNLKVMLESVAQRCRHILESPSLHRLPTIKKSLVEVTELLQPITPACNKIIDDLQNKHYSQKQYDSITVPYDNLLTRAYNWLAKYYQDVSKAAYVLRGNNLPVFDLRSITKPIIEPHRDVKHTHVFVLHFTCITNGLDKRFKQWTKDPAKDLHVFNSETSDEPNMTWENIYKEWQGFLDDSFEFADKDMEFAVGILSPSSPYKEGTVVTIGNDEILRAVNCTSSNKILLYSSHLTSAGSAKRCRQD